MTALLLQLAVGALVSVRRWRAVRTTTPAPLSAPADAGPPGAWAGWREFRVSWRGFEDPARTQCSFELQPVDGQPLPAFRPGQFLTFGLEIAPPAGQPAAAPRVLTRCYSLSDRPDPTHYRVTIKRVPAPAEHPGVEPGLASGYFHDQVQVGQVLRVRAPAGRFHIDPDAGVPAVLIAGGIGITPMMSMLRWSLAEQPERTLYLFHGVRNRREQAFGSVLESMAASHPALHLHIACSRPDAADLAPGGLHRPGRQHAGHVDIDLLRRTLPRARHQFYVCGPPAMMEALVPALAVWGVPVEDIHFEAFGPASIRLPGAPQAAAPGSLAVEVRFRRSGRTLTWDGRDATLLDFAQRHGIAVESGCRCGGCGTCETRLLEGTVRYRQAPDHAVKPGHCLLCVGLPTSALVLEA